VREAGEHLVFLHRIEPGGADRSYGIHVARLAGIPDEVVTRARAVLQQLEQTSPVLASDARPAQAGPQARKPAQLTLFSVGENRAMKALREVDISRLSPEQALAELLRLRELARDQG
jgi:DNA mismatch repair protein MutS